MSLRINTNVAALNSYNNLNANQAKLEGAFQQLSSGLRINKAADDAAGLSIAQGLTSQINGLTQAVSNANDGINVAQIADGALGTTQDILQRMRGLVVKAANVGTQDSKSLGAIQQEIQNLNTQLDNISGQTKFGQTNLLDGSYNKNFQVGANGNDTIRLDLSKAGVSSNNIAATGVDLNKLNIAKSGTVVADGGFQLSATGGTVQHLAAGALAADTAAGVAALFGKNAAGNAYTQLGGASGATVLAVSDYNAASGSWSVRDSSTNVSLGSITLDSTTGVYNVMDTAGNSLGSVASAVADPAFTDASVSTANLSSGSLKDALTSAGITGSTAVSGNATDGWTIAGSNATVSVQNGVYTIKDSAGIAKAWIDTNTSSAGTAGAVTTYSTADSTQDLAQIDKSIDGISKARSQIGAVQNQLGYTVSNLQTAITNVTASRSNLTDADLAQQVTAMTQSQILTQAATSVLAQANSAPQAILKLLQ